MSLTVEEAIPPHKEAIRLDTAPPASREDEDAAAKAGGFEKELAMFRALGPEQRRIVLDAMVLLDRCPAVADYFIQAAKERHA